MIDLLTGISSLLSVNGFGTIGTNLFVGAMPEQPDTCTAVVQTGGGRVTGEPTRTPQITILHRRKNLQTATTFITSLNGFLTSDNGFHTLSGFAIGRFLADAEPGLSGYDERNLLVFQAQYTFVTTQQL